MNRRSFLKFLLPTSGAAVVAPELLAEIWTPKRTIFLPPRGGWLSALFTGETGRYENIRIAEQPWAVRGADGGYMYSRELADTLRMNIQPIVRFRDGAGVVPDRLTWDVFGDSHAVEFS
jgi:hypothetical protein